MRLRYLYLNGYAPLSEINICFSGNEPWVALTEQTHTQCAIHFVVGLNGSGKSHLLRALASVFLALADERLPAFPVTLIYELGIRNTQDHRTLVFDSPGEKSQAGLWQANVWAFDETTNEEGFAAEIESLRRKREQPQGGFITRIAPGSFPQSVPDVLPKLLAYTSGSWKPWREVWHPPATSEGMESITQVEDYLFDLERLPGWRQADENELEDTGQVNLSGSPSHATHNNSDMFRRPLLLEGNRLDAALMVVALHDMRRKKIDGRTDEHLAELFKNTGWQCLVSVRLRLNLDRARQAPRALQRTLHDLLLVAGEVISEPRSGEPLRVLHFDVNGSVVSDRRSLLLSDRLNDIESQGDALTLLLGEKNESAFNRFGELLRWLATGLVDDIEMSIRRTEKPREHEYSPHDSGVMAYSELSDGEQMVLRRWGLFHLLAGQKDALLLLDEPETHFNDAWKREIVNIIEKAMGNDPSSVLIATHSAIVLSDVFDEEIIHIIKGHDGTSTANKVTSRTFATDPSALMMSLFNTEDSIGKRALKRIETYIDKAKQKTSPTPVEMQHLRALIGRLGTGFYRTELRTLLKRWEQNLDAQAIAELIPKLQPGQLRDGLFHLIEPENEQGGDDA